MLYIPQIINFKYFFAHSNYQAYTLIIIKKFRDHNIYALIIIIMSHLFVFYLHELCFYTLLQMLHIRSFN